MLTANMDRPWWTIYGGLFTFVIWDEKRRGLFLARDNFEIKLLYFHDYGETFRLASQGKAILAGGGIAVQPEPAGHIGWAEDLVTRLDKAFQHS